jgi:hypothetical protein
MLYDLFVCHTSEDKESFVSPLAEALKLENVEVWYDEFSLKLGDSIRRAIDKGLSQSRFGIVVLSKDFFEKKWPQYELDGLAEREMKGRDNIILPVWHNITHNEVMAYSPALAGRKAVSSSEGLKKVVSEILAVLHPQGSPLIIARDILLDWGLTPPVITDKYWLHIVEASNRLPGYGAWIPEESTWYRWSFPLPSKGGSPEQWGERLAWTAMQLNWVKTANEVPITILTHPEEVLDFIYSHSGLFETCKTFPSLLAEYAPQLTIPGMGGDLEEVIEEAYQKSCARYKKLYKENPRYGSGITINKEVRLCDEEWSLRHPSFGNYEPVYVAEAYFSGGMFGPRVSNYEHTEHIVWLLSKLSSWMPYNTKKVLIEGMKDWAVWTWYSHKHFDNKWKTCGTLYKAMNDAKERRVAFTWQKKSMDDLRNRIKVSINTLKLPDSVEDIINLFLKYRFAEEYAKSKKKYRRKRKNVK